MIAPVFVDTNVLLYARDTGESRKQAQAAAWLERLWREREGRTSMQVLSEYYVNLTRKLKPGLPPDAAWDDVTALFAWRPQPVDEALLVRGREIEHRYRIGWWDSLVISAAELQGCAMGGAGGERAAHTGKGDGGGRGWIATGVPGKGGGGGGGGKGERAGRGSDATHGEVRGWVDGYCEGKGQGRRERRRESSEVGRVGGGGGGGGVRGGGRGEGERRGWRGGVGRRGGQEWGGEGGRVGDGLWGEGEGGEGGERRRERGGGEGAGEERGEREGRGGEGADDPGGPSVTKNSVKIWP